MFQNNKRLYSISVLVVYVAFFFIPLTPNVNQVFASDHDEDRGFWDIAKDIWNTGIGIVEITGGAVAISVGVGTMTAAGTGSLAIGIGVVTVTDGVQRAVPAVTNLLNDISDAFD